jgi:hypothetical protein
MNIALTSFVLFLLLVPGIIFRRFYYTGEFSKQYFKSSALELVFSTVIPATLLHCLWMFLANKWFRQGIDVATVTDIITGNHSSKHWPATLTVFKNSYHNIVVYNISLWFFSAGIGLLFKFIIRKTKLDRKIKMFRFQNEWFYLLSGEYLDFPKVRGNSKNILITYVDVLVKNEAGDFIYQGILEDYLLSKEGALELLYMSAARCRPMDDSASKGFQKIHGRIFIIPYAQIKNINITYLRY